MSSSGASIFDRCVRLCDFPLFAFWHALPDDVEAAFWQPGELRVSGGTSSTKSRRQVARAAASEYLKEDKMHSLDRKTETHVDANLSVQGDLNCKDLGLRGLKVQNPEPILGGSGA